MYVLERHIGRYFALKPGTKKVGMHRGEGYYPREALAELHTADRCGLTIHALHADNCCTIFRLLVVQSVEWLRKQRSYLAFML